VAKKMGISILMKKLATIVLFFSVLLMLFACEKELSTPKPYPITCYAASYGQGIYFSNNGGESWYPLDMDQKDYYSYFKHIYLVPTNKHNIYITTTGAGLYKADLSTGDIERIDRFKEQDVTSLVFIDNYDSGMNLSLLLGLNNGGVYQSDTAFKSWQVRNQGLIYHEINTLYNHEQELYAGTTHDLFKWDKNENRWVSFSQGIKNKNILSINSTSDNKTLFAGSGGYNGIKGRFENIPCLYKSIDAGQSWQASDEGIPDGTLIYSLAVTRPKPEKIYAGTSDGIYLSVDEGKSWAKTEEGLPDQFRVFDIKDETMKDGNSVIYAVGSKGVFMTVDDGKSGWVSKNYGLPQTAMTSIVVLND
jgi:hypothetical protein